jgi:hypothetical protein
MGAWASLVVATEVRDRKQNDMLLLETSEMQAEVQSSQNETTSQMERIIANHETQALGESRIDSEKLQSRVTVQKKD